MGLDGPAHLAEEIPQPKRFLPRIMIIVILRSPCSKSFDSLLAAGQQQ
uniref:Uncharacterized protein n=1 Tax=Fusarium oxysporum (strain Fo5176) TaxID=660025 RepID=A0A0D2Y1U8_FUSOF